MQEALRIEGSWLTLNLGRVRAFVSALLSHFPLTLQGSLALVLSAGALRLIGYGSMDLVVFALCLCALFVVILSLFATVIGGLVVQRKVMRELQSQPSSRSSAAAFEAGYHNSTEFSLPAITWLPLVRLNWRIVSPADTETLNERRRDNRLHETIVPAHRGKNDAVIRRFEVRDALGLCSYSWLATQPLTHMILPRLGAYHPFTLQRARITADGLPETNGEPLGDRMEIRPYAPGDSVRDIMWKGFARNRQLNVRLPERSVAFDDKACAYLVSGMGDEAAAALARLTLESGLLGEDWRFGADGAGNDNSSANEYRSLADALVAIADSAAPENLAPHSYGLDRFLAAQHCSHCLVFASARDSEVLAKLAATAQSHTCRLNLVIGVDIVGRHTPKSRLDRMLWKDSDGLSSNMLSSNMPSSNALASNVLASNALAKTRRASPVLDLTTLSQRVESIVLVDRTSGDLVKISDLKDAILG
jgi:hypothetical protein